MTIKANGAADFKAPTGGSPRGWSFIGSASECWTRWAYRYVYGLYPATTPDYFDLGSAYHALQEGKTVDEVKALYPEHLEEAQRLLKQRQKGPPLPPAKSIEETVVLFGGLMTSKPDRVEQSGTRTIVRDFKTAAMFSKNDEQAWGVDGGILGECIAGETDTALVDIVSKQYDAKVPTKIVTVKLTPEKRTALERTVKQFWGEAEQRTRSVAAAKPTRDLVLSVYTQNLKGCVGKYSVCPYYARCWERGSQASMLYKQSTEPPRNWAEFKPAISWRKALDTAYSKTKGLV